MKQALTRLGIYVILFFFFSSIFTPDFFSEGPLPNSTLGGKIGFYLSYYGVAFGFWAAVYELIYWGFRGTARLVRKKKPGE